MPNLDRQADCPSCGATVTFKFAGSRAVVCDYCHSVVARTDRGLELQGKMADLLEIPSPLSHGATGKWDGEPFEVIGRVQMDRAGAPGAPWQEILVWFSLRDATQWVATAQGRWYATTDVAVQAPVPDVATLRPGSLVDLGAHGHFVVQEVGQRRVISGEGSLPDVPKPGVVTRYADISGREGAFGTLDYGDGTASPQVFVGRQFDPRAIVLDSGIEVAAPQAKVSAAECPNCGASLPLVSERTERVACQYCGMQSDVTRGHLQAIGPAPRPVMQPVLPLGSRGKIRSIDCVVCGFLIRSCRVEGELYSWREYLLFAGDAHGYRWIMEEDGQWYWCDPVEVGEVEDRGRSATFRGARYNAKPSVTARVDYVVGEFYWKIETGETVSATELVGPGGKLSREQTPTEVTYSFVSDLHPDELFAFGVRPPAVPRPWQGPSSSAGGAGKSAIFVILVCIVIFFALISRCGGGFGGSSRSYGGGSWSK